MSEGDCVSVSECECVSVSECERQLRCFLYEPPAQTVRLGPGLAIIPTKFYTVRNVHVSVHHCVHHARKVAFNGIAPFRSTLRACVLGASS